jgi:hypothetical protein
MWIRNLGVNAVVAGTALLLFSRPVQARPQYNKEFWARYEKEVGTQAESVKCGACHFGKEKKNRNDYGKAIGTAIGEKDVKDVEKIKEALDKAAKDKSSVEGKTFGDLIKDGKLPGKNPD